MRTFISSLVLIPGLWIAVSLATPAHAQATRTWVSGVGDDANPCSRTAPCKTFAGAISKTAANGEINCIDPGGFGAVTITKSITVDCAGTFGSILAAGTNGINVNAAGIIVAIRNVSINGVGSGLVGINFVQGAKLHVENVVIRGFRSGTANGIRFAPGASAELSITDTVVADNGSGIVVKPTGAAVVGASLQRVTIENNTLDGVSADTTGSTATVWLHITNSVSAGNTNAGLASIAPVGASSLIADRVSVVSNGTGLSVSGANGRLFMNASSITQNNTGLAKAADGTLFSYGNNAINGNRVSNGVAPDVLTLR
jgi:hypothetical protein